MTATLIVFTAIFVVAFVSYLIGSIPTGYIVVKAITGQDIRETGSGSTGATNVKRVLGTGWFFTVMILDILKGALPVFLVQAFIHDTSFFTVLAAGCVVLGHSKPVFLQFRGGKSVASGIGTIIALNPVVGLTVGAIWAVITFFTKYVSVGSIIAVIVAPILMYYFKSPMGYTLYCIVVALYIIILHWQNIVRLIKGEENKVR